MTDDGRGALLPGATEGAVTVQGVQVGYGGGVFGGAQDDTACASGRGETDIENLFDVGRSADVSHGLPGQGTPAELPGGGMPKTSGDKDSNAGNFSALECPGHRGHFGGCKPPPPMVPLMQHAVPLAYN